MKNTSPPVKISSSEVKQTEIKNQAQTKNPLISSQCELQMTIKKQALDLNESKQKFTKLNKRFARALKKIAQKESQIECLTTKETSYQAQIQELKLQVGALQKKSLKQSKDHTAELQQLSSALETQKDIAGQKDEEIKKLRNQLAQKEQEHHRFSLTLIQQAIQERDTAIAKIVRTQWQPGFKYAGTTQSDTSKMKSPSLNPGPESYG